MTKKMNRTKCKPHLAYETSLWLEGEQYIAGLDEAGRGAWAGPVAAAAVILPADPDILEKLHGVRDSKLMSARQRDLWACEIKKYATGWAVGFTSNHEIDCMGIVPATRLAMQRALFDLSLHPSHLLIDALKLVDSSLPQTVIIRGDQCSLSIAAASILAKTARDRLMTGMDESYPGYQFARHKGYGTAIHRKALQTMSPCQLHRFSFKPVRLLTEQDGQEAELTCDD